MKPGDVVRVYPHGHPEQAAMGIVASLSTGSMPTMLLVKFTDPPPFALGGRLAGVALLLLCHHGVGSWEEVFRGGRYEVENA